MEDDSQYEPWATTHIHAHPPTCAQTHVNIHIHMHTKHTYAEEEELL